jgi:predicted nucleic acid binding AN1-type Zn finger protein
MDKCKECGKEATGTCQKCKGKVCDKHKGMKNHDCDKVSWKG